jgi:hypothetical protein
MTTAADDRAAEDAFEALLAGRPAPGGAAGLAAFTGAVRDAADRPGRPNAALADLLSTGLLTDQSSPSSRTAPTAGIPSGSRGRTRRRFTVIVPALIAKFLAAGAVAQAAAGAGVVVVVVAGAGTAGALPEDAQTAFSDLTGIGETTEEPTDVLLPPTEEVVTPVEGDGSLDPTDPTPPVAEVPGTTDDEPVEPVEPTDAEKAVAWAEAGEMVTTQAEFKAWLAEGKENGWVTGQAVSAAAHARNEARKAARAGAEDTEETPEVEAPEVETPDEDADEQEDETEVEDSGKGGGKDSGKSSAKGNGGGKGKDRG